MPLQIAKKIVVNVMPYYLVEKIRSYRSKKTTTGPKSLAEIFAGLRKQPPYTKTTVDVNGVQFITPDARTLPALYEDLFTREMFHFDCADPEPLFLDCGANIGMVTIYLKQRFPKSRIIAFEPDDDCFEALTTNCAGLENVECKKTALWNRDGMIDFNAVGGEGGMIQELVAADPAVKRVTVPCVRLYDFLDQPVAFLKMDVEGAEFEILRDCKSRLRNVERIFVEYHSFADSPQKLTEFIDILESEGFRLHIQAPDYARRPFEELPVFNHKDLRLNIFAMRSPVFRKVRW